MRVHELAKEFNLQSKDLINRLHELKLDLKSHMSTLTDDQVALARKILASTPAAKPAAEAPKTATAASARPIQAPTMTIAIDPPPIPVQAPAPTAPIHPPVLEAQPAPTASIEKKVVIVRGPIIVREFAEQLGLKPNQLIAELMAMNVFASINQKIELKAAQHLADKHGFALEHEKKAPPPKPAAPPPKEKSRAQAEDTPDNVKPRPPVVAFMGHVDHGKTSLLDRIRNTKVAAGESGGITQHIGAYSVKVGEKAITFMDTPGHEAFTSMRARGANLTDIVVLVVDAVDGVMPQTKEAIQHAKAAGVNIMVAANKVDLRAANVDRLKLQLQQEGITPEDWGGEVVVCPVSATTGQGVDHLLEMILLQADLLELKANPQRPGQGYVIEAQLQPGRGPTATLLVRRGTLHVGDPIVCGAQWGRVKALINDHGKMAKEAGPSQAVVCLGLPGVPEAGAEFVAYASDREARDVAEQRVAQKQQEDLASSAPKRMSLEDFLKGADAREKTALNVILKADVQGSLEAIQHGLGGVRSEKISMHVILAGVGNINVNDVLLASASDAIIIGFHVSKDSDVSSMAKREGVEIRLYSIIYELIDDVRDAMLGLLEPILRENVVGHAEVRQVFDLSKKGKVAGCLVLDGRVASRARARIKRKGDVLYVGSVSTLKRFQNDAAEVRESQECGIRLDNFSDYQTGDVIELFEVEKITQQL
ncbi:MAG: translation initiation factor IF-2 [bacterium]